MRGSGSALLSLFYLCLFLPASIEGVSFVFDGFDSAALKMLNLQEAAVAVEGNAIRLTNDSRFIIGRAMYALPIRPKTEQGEALSFSSSFIFSIVKPPGNLGGHGIVFVMTPSRSISATALTAQYFGLQNITSLGDKRNHLFAVEFDTNQNVEFGDPDSNHVGIDINTLYSIAAVPAGYYTTESPRSLRKIVLTSGKNIQAWVDYNYTRRRLTVAIAPAGEARPEKPLISAENLDLSSILTDSMYIGFSTATGNLVEEHYILSWSFSTDGPAASLATSQLPSFSKGYSQSLHRKALIVGVSLATLAVLTALTVAFSGKMRDFLGSEEMEEWEKEFWPHRFSYRELCVATADFSSTNVLGCGGFGKVYRGRLPRSGDEIAVKCISKEMTEGMKSFIAEISSMGRVQHRNLVRLRGWCRRRPKLFIVYDYMPNGSLDSLIFAPIETLPWKRRFDAAKDVTAALVYLHEQWEKCVVHRDIKSSNVLLDSEMNARLGDFGLAKLYEHTDNPHTTQVVGTVGYIAPELIQTGKATPASDVFSLGCVFLELVCGRRPVEPYAREESQVILSKWLWELCSHHDTESVLEQAADPRLMRNYPAEEMEMVLKMGLLCTHPVPECRPKARHLLKILEREVDLPAWEFLRWMSKRESSVLGRGHLGLEVASVDWSQSCSRLSIGSVLATQVSAGR